MKRFCLGAVLLGVVFVGCSNLSSPRFSEGFYEEKRYQLTRKAELRQKGKLALIAFCTYVSNLDPKAFPDEEVFLIELSFEKEGLGMKDLRFSLLGKPPLRIQKVGKDEEKRYRLYRHNPWNALYLVRFDPILPVDVNDVILRLGVGGESLGFDYSYVVENVL